jgi:hypothetical protein
MAGTLSNPQISGSIQATLAAAAANNATSTNINHTTTVQPTVGSSAGNANKVFDVTVTIASSGTPGTIDLTSVTDPQGNALSFSALRALKITNLSTTAGQDITPFGGTNGLVATGTIVLKAGSANSSVTYDFGSAEIAVDSTHKIIQLAVAAGTSVLCNVTGLGR